MNVFINPIQPTKSQFHLLKTLLLSNHERTRIWEKDVPYEIIYQDQPIQVILSSTIVKRASKKEKPRYEVIRDRGNPLCEKEKADPPLGVGGYAIVYPIDHTLKLKHGQLIRKLPKEGHTRVAKIFQSRNPAKRARFIRDAHHEYLMESRTAHLHPKMPVISQKQVVSILRYMSGHDLFDVQHHDMYAVNLQSKLARLHSAELNANFEERYKKNILSLDKRFEFSLLLLKALKEQVFDLGLIHRDIKPENICIDIHTKQIYIIDYGLAKIDGPLRPSEKSVGTPGFISPEGLHAPRHLRLKGTKFFEDDKLEGTSQLSDIYSMGRVLTLFWGLGDMTSYDYAVDGPSILEYGFSNDYSTLFDLMPAEQRSRLDSRAAATIKIALEKMTAYLPEDRIDIQQAIDAFTKAKNLQYAAYSRCMQPLIPLPIKQLKDKMHLTQFKPAQKSRDSDENQLLIKSCSFVSSLP